MKNFIMKNQLSIFFAFAALIIGVFLGQNVFAQTPDSIPTASEYLQLFSSLQGIGGLKAAGIITLIVQALMLIVRQFVQGKYKLLIVSALTLIGAAVSAYISGGNFASVMTNSVVLTSVQVLVNQIFTQIKKPA
jgi:hypothetical protein